MVEDYAILKDELSTFIRGKGSVSAQELVAWAQGRDVGELTLYLLVQELLESQEFRGEGEPYCIEPNIKLEIPSRLVYVKKEVKAARSPPPKRQAKRRQRSTSSQSLLKFLQEEEKKEEPKEEEQRVEEEEKKEVDAKPQPQIHEVNSYVQEKQTLPEIDDILNDPEFAKVARYLGRYWSVGRLRFLSDMLNENIPVQKAEKILLELRRRGLVELTDNDVINAKDVLREYYRKNQPKTPLYDIFS